MRIIVVGAGVVGLSCAVRLLEAGHRVDVVARDLPRETTSAVAAAIWYPYRALPQDRVTAWAAASYAVFAALAAPEEYGGSPEVGVRMVPGTELFTSAQADPWWSAAVPRLDRVRDLPPGFVDGWSFTAPVIEMPVYLTWLTDPGRGARRHADPAEPARAAGGRRPRRELLRARGAAAR